VRLECAAGAAPSEGIFHLAVAKGWVLKELAREALSLEDVFVRLTRREEAVEPAAAAEPLPQAQAPGSAPSSDDEEVS
jgi:hypothetical protein